MKKHVIFAAIIASMIGTVAFAQEATVEDAGSAAQRAAEHIEQMRGAIGVNAAAGVSAVGGAAEAAQGALFSNNTNGIAKALIGQSVHVAVGGQCTGNNAMNQLTPAQKAVMFKAENMGLVNDPCLGKSDVSVLPEVLQMKQAQEQTLANAGFSNVNDQGVTESLREAIMNSEIKAIYAYRVAHHEAGATLEAAAETENELLNHTPVCWNTKAQAQAGEQLLHARYGID